MRSLPLVCTLLVGCAADVTLDTSRHAITAGTLDEGDPAVVAITRDGAIKCSGSVIAERVVLTAAHCLVQSDPSAFRVRIGVRDVALLHAVSHPEWDSAAGHDLALLLLAEPSGVEPAPFGGAFSAPPQSDLRLVGFGAVDATGAIDGKKREGRSKSTELVEQWAVLAADPSLPCNGDSGGPVFVGREIAGVVSRGDPSCATYGKATRVDVNAAKFIAPFIASTARSSTDDGNACFYDAQCRGGACVQAEDEPRLRYCSRTCSSDAECSGAMTCVRSQCRHPLPSPGAVGATCSTDSACLDGRCLDAHCTRHCVSGGNDCPTGYACTLTGGIDFLCTRQPEPPASEGGCSFSRLAQIRASCTAPARRTLDLGPVLMLLALGCRRIGTRRRLR